jgi:hypothetical protein
VGYINLKDVFTVGYLQTFDMLVYVHHELLRREASISTSHSTRLRFEQPAPNNLLTDYCQVE